MINFDQIRTTEDLAEAKVELSKQAEALYKNSGGTKEAVGQREELISQFVSRLEDLKPFKLILAFYPNGALIEKIYQWVRSNLAGGYVLDLETDQSIIGGAIIEHDGEHKDLSLKKIFDQETRTPA